jgi:phosphoribosylamine--glycine ligase
MNVLLVGSGGREHALAWKLKQSPMVTTLCCAPGNPGMRSVAECIPVKAGDVDGLLQCAQNRKVDFVVVGPEQPLSAGIVDRFEARGIPIFGPTRAAAALEWSKVFAKNFMRTYNIPTASYEAFSIAEIHRARTFLKSCSLPVVLKADGLAAGKGVIICGSREEAIAALHTLMESPAFGDAGKTIVVEEFMEGVEASVFAISDGKDFVMLAPAQDHKRIFDDDLGKNTGGMGAYAPTPFVTREMMDLVERTIISPTLDGMSREGRPYKGCLYVGLMLTKDGPRVVEYNCRFGDPESQVVVPLFDGDLARLMYASASGTIRTVRDAGVAQVVTGHAVCVVLASQGYPDEYRKGLEITGLEEACLVPGAAVFHAGTETKDSRLVTAGGRVLGVTVVRREGPLAATIDEAYRAVRCIHFEGMHYRRDIGRKALRAIDIG